MADCVIMRPQFNWPPQVVEHFGGRDYQPITEADSVTHTILTPEESKVSDETRETLYSTLPLRFWVKSEMTEICWVWLGARFPKGYGCFAWQGKNVGAHRLVWRILHGEIPANMMICHRCDNPPCFNPAHLFIGTNRDNIHDAVKKGRIFSPLTEDQVSAIKLRITDGENKTEIAKRYGVSHHVIVAIADSIAWSRTITACWTSHRRARGGFHDSRIHVRCPNGNTACGRPTTAMWDQEEHQDDGNIDCAGCRRAIAKERIASQPRDSKMQSHRVVGYTSCPDCDCSSLGVLGNGRIVRHSVGFGSVEKVGPGTRHPNWHTTICKGSGKLIQG